MEFEHLILLVGTNPLPNYVVAKYFITNNLQLKKIWLIYSEKTSEVAERLGLLIGERGIDEFSCPCELTQLSDIGCAKKISDEVTEHILDKIKPPEKLHLNYTGGTKMMGVHVHRTIREYKELTESAKSYSYLDARDHTLKDDEKNIISGYLRKEITITPEHLLRLHGCVENPERQREKKGKEAALT